MSALAFRNMLEAGDLMGLWSAWASWFPQMPRPESREQAEIVMHVARTAAVSCSLKARAYSHRWLCERDLPSQLPDNLRPSAERLYPKAALGVGLSVNARRGSIIAPAVGEVRKAMEDAVNDADAEKRLSDTAFVTKRIHEAKARTIKALFGI